MTTTAASVDEVGTSTLPTRARIVIVGGGVIGSSIAYHLTKRGERDVLLIERHALTSGTTWHAAGLITSAGFADETGLYLSRYSRDLYSRLEEETGLSTGYRQIGHLSLACTPERAESMKREGAFHHLFGVESEDLTAKDVANMWPLARVDDVLAAHWVPDEGRADPVGVTMSLAKGAKMGGATMVEGVTVTGFTTEGGRVTGVVTDQGTVETEIVITAAGMWSRQIAATAGVDVALQAAEHYYLITEEVPGSHRDLPVIEDPDRYGYYRPEGDGMLVGLFEPVGKAWQLDGIPNDFSFGEIPPDWDRLGPYVERAMERIPSLADIGIRKFFCGPESFTPDILPMLGPAPELDNFFLAAGLNSLGILLGGGVGNVMAEWVLEGAAPVDVAAYSVERVVPHEVSRKFRKERTVEQLGVLFGDAVWPAWQPKSARGVRRSVLHDRHGAAAAHFSVSAGWEFPEWFGSNTEGHPDPAKGFERSPAHDVIGVEHVAVRNDVGIFDMSLMAKFDVQGPDAAAVLSRLSANHIDREVGRVVYTQWLDHTGGIVADLTITRTAENRFLVVASDVIERRVAAMIRRQTRGDEHVHVTNITSGSAILSVQGPKSRELLSRLTDADLANDAFPYMSAQTIHLGYARVLALRVTYVGELGWELHVPTEYAVGVYDELLAVGSDLGCRAVGLDALTSLRLEKGYRDMVVDIDNTDNPLTAGLGFAVAFDKPGGFVGRDALLKIRDNPQASRLVQVLLGDPAVDLFGNEPVLRNGQAVGYVRVGAFGHSLGAAVGLAGVDHEAGVDQDWLTTGSFTVETPQGRIPARVSLKPMFDPGRAKILV